MQLARLAQHRWEVLLVCSSRGTLQVLEELKKIAGYTHVHKRALTLLERTIPETGPPKNNKEKCRNLRREIWELKIQSRGAPGIRILFFEDGQAVICTNAHKKDQGSVPNEIARVEETRAQYFEAKQNNQLEIFEIQKGAQE